MKSKNLFTAVVFSFLALTLIPAIHANDNPTRQIALTFDDVPGVQMGGVWCNSKAYGEVNNKLIRTLTSNNIPALGLVVESRWCEARKPALSGLLKLWLDAGMELGNHSYSHFDLNTTPLNVYQADVIRGEATTQRLLQERGMKLRYFRHPYLHAGKDIETKKSFDRFLAERGYQLAPVTIDNQEWVFAEVYARALRRHDPRAMQRVGEAYITYMEELVAFFEKLSIEVVGYEIKQVLLLHDNPLNADYLDELVELLKKRGYSFISLDKALEDPAYRLPDTYAGPIGLSWLHRWAISKGMQMKPEPAEPQWIRQLFESR
jgi:peptidoglycan-N-acetylglucosamine deacetylase